LGDCFYGFGDSSLLLSPYWVTAFTVLTIPACFIALLGDCFYGFGDLSLLLPPYWVTALIVPSFSACLFSYIHRQHLYHWIFRDF